MDDVTRSEIKTYLPVVTGGHTQGGYMSVSIYHQCFVIDNTIRIKVKHTVAAKV